ncbi:MAG: spore coat protein [Candidatus Neomarinimicrobiota bacterium]|nr:MAG: spore coat protein [Candidatus Neomarinimicrobiota bacterium]
MKLIKDAEKAYFIQDYSKKEEIKGVKLIELVNHIDEGGCLIELMRLKDGESFAEPGFNLLQINYSEMEPEAIKAFHIHKRQTDIWFVPPSDRLLVVLADVRENSETEGKLMRLTLGGGKPYLLVIPPGVAHGCKNLKNTTSRIIYFTNLHFSPDPGECDEGRLPWHFFGEKIWESKKD